jgi:hypothetical protein
MKKFVLKSLLFIPITFILLQIIPLYLIYTGQYKNTVAGYEIYHSIFKSKQKKQTKKILLGDSVGRQLFSNTTNNDTINSLACNQSIAMVGQYILLNNYLLAGNTIDTVFMIFTPFTFRNNLDQIFTYHYFLKPFYTKEYFKFYTKKVHEQVGKIPFRQFCRLPFILTSNWAPFFVSKDEISYTFLSPLSVEYLNKIKELSIKYNFKIIIVAPPLSIYNKIFIEKMDRNEIVKNNLSKEFENYFENIIYLDDAYFVDHTHLKNPQKYTTYFRNKFLKTASITGNNN